LAEDRIATNLRMLLILEVIGNAEEAISPTEIARELDLPKQTAHRLCTTLIDEGFVVRDSPSKKLRPARRLRQIATGILQASRYHIARHQILIDVARETSETVNYVMPEENGMSYKDRVETDWAFRVLLPVGSHVPFHCTASGKCFLASLPKQERQKLVDSIPMDRLTPNTIVDRGQLMEELKLISRQGFATDNEEFMEGMVAIAVPVRDQKGRFLAALAFHGPSVRLSLESVISKKEYMAAAAQRLTDIVSDPNT